MRRCGLYSRLSSLLALRPWVSPSLSRQICTCQTRMTPSQRESTHITNVCSVLFMSCSKFAFSHLPAQPPDPEKCREPDRALPGWPARRGKGGAEKYLLASHLRAIPAQLHSLNSIQHLNSSPPSGAESKVSNGVTGT